MAATGGKKKKSKGKTLNLNEFLSSGGSAPAPGASYVLANKSSSWADEMDDSNIDPEDSYEAYSKPQKVINRAALPTAPRAARGPGIDLDTVPTDPPFTAFLGNLPFDVSEEEIERFFQGLQITVRIPDGRAKGFAYADFEDRTSLIEALSQNEGMIRNRRIRIDLADNQGGDGRRRREDDGDDRTLGDWRSGGGGGGGRDGPRGGFDDRYSDRSGGGGRYGDDRYGDRNDRYSDRNDPYGDRNDRYSDQNGENYGDRYGERDRYGGRDRYGDRDRYRGDRYSDRGGDRYGNRNDRYGDRNGERSGDRYDGDRDRYGGGRDRYGDRDRYGGDRSGGSSWFGDRDRDRGGFGDRDRDRGGFGDRDGGRRNFGSGYGRDGDRDGYRRDDRDGAYRSFGGGRDDRDGDWGRGRSSYQQNRDSSPQEEPRERRKLTLQPRSAPEGQSEPDQSGSQPPPSGKSNPFGEARPVDTRYEDRPAPAREKPAPRPANDEPSAPKQNPFGDARPVDTGRREIDDRRQDVQRADDRRDYDRRDYDRRDDRRDYDRRDYDRRDYDRRDQDRHQPDQDVSPRDRGGDRDGEPRGRPRLNLAPRTKPVEDKGATQSSIFGSAKPVDTAAREREIEQRLRQQREAQERRDGPGAVRGVGGGSDSGKIRHDSTDSSGRRDRERKSSSSSGKGIRTVAPPPGAGSARVHRSSSTASEEDVFHEDKPTSPSVHKDEASARFVPAEAPKENPWLKRSPQSQPTSPPAQPSSPPASNSQSPPSKEPTSPSSKEPPQQNSSPPDSSKDTNDVNMVPSEPPKENPWGKRSQTNASPDSSNTNESTNAWGAGRGRGSDNLATHNLNRGAGRGSSNERTTGQRSRVNRGPAGRGTPNERATGQRREKREKPLPQSIEEMPKYEAPKGEDLGSVNKFAMLMDDEEVGNEGSGNEEEAA